MSFIGIAWGMIGSTTIVACLYMAEHGYAWWQIALMALLGSSLMPYLKTRSETNETDASR